MLKTTIDTAIEAPEMAIEVPEMAIEVPETAIEAPEMAIEVPGTAIQALEMEVVQTNLEGATFAPIVNTGASVVVSGSPLLSAQSNRTSNHPMHV